MRYVIILLAILLAGCDAKARPAKEPVDVGARLGSLRNESDVLYRFDDHERGVSCYQTYYTNLSCVKTESK